MMDFLKWPDVFNAWWFPIVVFALAIVTVIAWAAVYLLTIGEKPSQRRSPEVSSTASRDEQALLWSFASGQIDAAECRDRLDALRRHRCCRPG